MELSQTSYRMRMPQAGFLDEIRLVEVARRPPGPDEVEVGIRALGLNFREVLKALGVYSGLEVDLTQGVSFDGDCAGVVVAAGENVTTLRPGDPVAGFGYDVFGSFATMPATHFVRMPGGLTFIEAATIPVVFMTAYYALHDVGRIVSGEKVLIHAAAGGVGLAAVQLCQRAGCEVFATVGSDAKREFLGNMGVRHIMNSRNLEFADQVMDLTGGKGVDVVLNALAGEFIPKSLGVLAQFGRFLEIGKRDIYSNTMLGLYPFRNNISFHGIDLLQMPPARIHRVLADVMELFDRDELKPLHHGVFPITQGADAFRRMRHATHIGKIVLSVNT
jgi:NADPH:quinone reductase-like Zn-dependent oxidoreductase